MDALILLIPLAILLGGTFAGLFLRAARQGQFDDLDDPPIRILRE
jgi:cbb3-type cytochrome oxidase maturation protein